MTREERIEIPLSRTKLILAFLGSLVFVALGLWFLVHPPTTNHWLFGNRTVIFVAGLVSVIFFGLVAGILFRKFSDKKPGLVLSRQGITDNSSGISVGLIPWTDIQEIRISKVMNQDLLMIIVRNPQDYLDKVANPFKRNVMKMNYKNYGSPLCISSHTLQMGFDDLQKLLMEKMNEYAS
ncbi:MAG: hypothetical protein IPL87_04520 [Candidatus Moraniibacteriota bacterium]|nr:MAG: hypothetical protein IPL87_04520 [Candidatus Moranbacteria bacterium]